MKLFRAEVHGHIVDARYGEWGGESVIIDGKPVSQRPLAGWLPGKSHFVTITDESDRPRNLEVRFETPSLGIGKVRVTLVVDGVERCRLEPLSDTRALSSCANCGYQLAGLPVANGEIRCPECGRHTSALLLGIKASDSA